MAAEKWAVAEVRVVAGRAAAGSAGAVAAMVVARAAVTTAADEVMAVVAMPEAGREGRAVVAAVVEKVAAAAASTAVELAQRTTGSPDFAFPTAWSPPPIAYPPCTHREPRARHASRLQLSASSRNHQLLSWYYAGVGRGSAVRTLFAAAAGAYCKWSLLVRKAQRPTGRACRPRRVMTRRRRQPSCSEIMPGARPRALQKISLRRLYLFLS